MATAWNTTLYPIKDTSQFTFRGRNIVDTMSDGSVRTRLTTNLSTLTMTVDLAPMDEAEAEQLLDGLITAPTTEYAITHNGKTYNGYVDTTSLKLSVTEGFLQWITFTFTGVQV